MKNHHRRSFQPSQVQSDSPVVQSGRVETHTSVLEVFSCNISDLFLLCFVKWMLMAPWGGNLQSVNDRMFVER